MVKSKAKPPKFLQLTIEERERLRPSRRSPADRRSPVTFIEREAILWQWIRGLRPPRIARQLAVGATTVRDALADLYSCPSLLLRMKVFELAKAGGKTWWKCLLCGQSAPGGRDTALRHVLHEMFPDGGRFLHDPTLLSFVQGQIYLAGRRRNRSSWNQFSPLRY